ncbi:MAG TPA: alpha/beta hydrolase, partial [Candidatus Saccharimonadales bacterium]|nr:alpha/beta hydrolase [Candidatus Saccharimonadales bacterium]
RLVPASLQTMVKKGVYHSLGEWDYYKAGELKKTFQNVIAEDLSPVLPHITVPTLLLWGENDTFVRLSIGREIAQKIPHAIIKVFPQITHKLPYESPRLFAQEVLQFIQ